MFNVSLLNFSFDLFILFLVIDMFMIVFYSSKLFCLVSFSFIICEILCKKVNSLCVILLPILVLVILSLVTYLTLMVVGIAFSMR